MPYLLNELKKSWEFQPLAFLNTVAAFTIGALLILLLLALFNKDEFIDYH